jgi:hypothetical protein
MSKSKPTMMKVLKAAIEESEVSRYRIAQDTGILETSLRTCFENQSAFRARRLDIRAIMAM